MKKLRQSDPSIEFWVIGPDKEEIKYLFKSWNSGFSLLGWQDASKFMYSANLLLHPAASEPYGMAIAEATNYGIPVVISNQCGVASQISNRSGSVLDVGDSIDEWANSCLTELSRKDPVLGIGKSWRELAQQHIEIYRKL